MTNVYYMDLETGAVTENHNEAMEMFREHHNIAVYRKSNHTVATIWVW